MRWSRSENISCAVTRLVAPHESPGYLRTTSSHPVATMRLATLACCLLVGCRSKSPDSPPALIPQEAVGTVKQVMSGILEPAADSYWDAVGSVADKSGIHEFAPKTDEEWTAVERAALATAETGNLLMMEGRALDRDRWMTLAKGLVAAGKDAMAAAAS